MILKDGWVMWKSKKKLNDMLKEKPLWFGEWTFQTNFFNHKIIFLWNFRVYTYLGVHRNFSLLMERKMIVWQHSLSLIWGVYEWLWFGFMVVECLAGVVGSEKIRFFLLLVRFSIFYSKSQHLRKSLREFREFRRGVALKDSGGLFSFQFLVGR